LDATTLAPDDAADLAAIRPPWWRSGRAALIAAVLMAILGVMVSLFVERFDVVQLVSGLVAFALSFTAAVLGFSSKHVITGLLSIVAAVLSIGDVASTRFVRHDLGFRVPGYSLSAREAARRIARDDGIAMVEIVEVEPNVFTFTGMRGSERCEGRLEADVTPLSEVIRRQVSCGLPSDFEELARLCDGGALDACEAASDSLAQVEPLDIERMIRVAEPGCRLGAGLLCSNLAFAQSGRPSPDMTEVLRGYARACELRYGTGCTRAGRIVFNGNGMPVDREAGARFWTSGCEAEDATSCAALAECYHRGHGVPEDDERARELASKSCALEYPAGCYTEGDVFDEGNDADRAHAQESYEKGCRLGDGPSCARTQRAVANGWTDAPDPVGAFRELDRLCTAGNIAACMEQGVLLHEGREGLPRDRPAALALFERACAADDATGCRNVGIYLLDGLTGERDVERARASFRRGCELGEARACEDAR
jgi:TPR repeat protein